MASFFKRGLRTIGWIIASIVLGFIAAYIITTFIGINHEPSSFSIWGLCTLILAIPIRRVVCNTIKIEKQSDWERPQKIRDRVFNNPNFVGRLDREKGLLESKVSNIEFDEINQPHWSNTNGISFRIIRLRGVILDHQGVQRDSIPVEIRAKKDDWVGTILDGDRVRVEGKFKDDGILHADTAFNYSSNSIVGNGKQ